MFDVFGGNRFVALTFFKVQFKWKVKKEGRHSLVGKFFKQNRFYAFLYNLLYFTFIYTFLLK